MEIQECKMLIINKLSELTTDKDLLELVKNRIENVKVEVLDSLSFENKYREYNGEGFVPASFEYYGTVYINESTSDIHTLIHEFLHAISSYEDDELVKSGLLVYNKKDKYYFGRGLNEAATEYLASIIVNEDFQSYSIDFLYVIKLFMEIMNYSISDLLSLYFKNDNWCTENIINTFNKDNDSLKDLIIEFDNRLAGKGYNHINVINILLDSIMDKINRGMQINAQNIMQLEKNLINHYYDVDYEIDTSTHVFQGQVLDRLGEYSSKK